LDKGPSPEQALAENELRAAVTHSISHLRESLRKVVLLRELQGLTSSETAQRLGLTVSAVKARTFHARRYLRRHLEQKYKLLTATAWSKPAKEHEGASHEVKGNTFEETFQKVVMKNGGHRWNSPRT
jgi:hypothetical protein